MIKDNFHCLENKICKLKETNMLLAIKAEFEAEGTRIDELSVLSGLCFKWQIPLTLKIGGPSAKRDIYEAFQFGANNILVPMVESPFAAELCSEYFLSIAEAFKLMHKTPILLINLESKKTIENLDSILGLIEQKNLPINSVVIGRSDLANSLGNKDVNSSEILNIVISTMKKCSKYKIKCTLGGNITAKSFKFVKKLGNSLNAFESRKCTFLNSSSLNENNYNSLINAGLEFELSWLEFKQNMYSQRSNEENTRISLIKKRININ